MSSEIQDLLFNLTKDPDIAIKELYEAYKEFKNRVPANASTIDYYEGYLNFYGAASTLLDSLNIAYVDVKLTDNHVININHINTFIIESYKLALQNSSLRNFKNKFSKKYTPAFVYEFSPNELDQIQTAIDDLRQLITKANFIESDHKARLLKRLERLQSEIHKQMSDLDRFWGLVGDAGVVLGKFGNDVKPITDRIRDITEIVWKAQSQAEQLPKGTPFMLPESKNDE
jgi:hypothetical protein